MRPIRFFPIRRSVLITIRLVMPIMMAVLVATIRQVAEDIILIKKIFGICLAVPLDDERESVGEIQKIFLKCFRKCSAVIGINPPAVEMNRNTKVKIYLLRLPSVKKI